MMKLMMSLLFILVEAAALARESSRYDGNCVVVASRVRLVSPCRGRQIPGTWSFRASAVTEEETVLSCYSPGEATRVQTSLRRRKFVSGRWQAEAHAISDCQSRLELEIDEPIAPAPPVFAP